MTSRSFLRDLEWVPPSTQAGRGGETKTGKEEEEELEEEEEKGRAIPFTSGAISAVLVMEVNHSCWTL